MKKSYLFFLFLLLSLGGYTQLLTPQTVMFPTSHGDSLEVDVYLPSTTGRFPVILIQTPYGKYSFRNGLPLGIRKNLSSSNYAFVILDWRGRFANSSKASAGITIGEDGYDLVEWIAQQSWSTGKIGGWGPSALGNVQFETAKKQPPHLTCAVPQVASPHFFYEDYYAGGSARVQYLKQLSSLGFSIAPTVAAHPYYDNFWSFAEANSIYPDSIQIPMLMIGGWYDHNAKGTIFQFDTCTSKSVLPTGTKHHLLIGPWVHGGSGTAYVGSANQGQLTYANAAGISDTVALQFFDYHLRNVNNGWNAKPPVMYYQMGDNQWLEDNVFPPVYVTSTNYYLQDDLSLKTTSSPVGTGTFSYNPTSPSPTIGGATLNSSLQQGPYDQVPAVESRFDLITFNTPTLTQDLKIKGTVKANFYVSSDKKDTDVCVRITDVYPDGRSMLITDGIKRMRFRNGYRVIDTAFMTAGTVYPVSIELPPTSITIKAGHKLRVIITSSNYSMYNRNMNNGGIMYPGNELDSVLNPQSVTNKIHFGPSHPSHLVLPVDNTHTSLAEESNKLEVHVYPNPVVEVLFLDTEEEVDLIELVDLKGRLILSKSYGVNNIDFSGLEKGVYILKVTSRERTISKKIIKH